MVRVAFSQNLHSQIEGGLAPREVLAGTVREALEGVFSDCPRLRGYILDDQGAVRKHVAIFLDGETIADRTAQTDAVPTAGGEIFVMQALSGG